MLTDLHHAALRNRESNAVTQDLLWSRQSIHRKGNTPHFRRRITQIHNPTETVTAQPRPSREKEESNYCTCRSDGALPACGVVMRGSYFLVTLAIYIDGHDTSGTMAHNRYIPRIPTYSGIRRSALCGNPHPAKYSGEGCPAHHLADLTIPPDQLADAKSTAAGSECLE